MAIAATWQLLARRGGAELTSAQITVRCLDEEAIIVIPAVTEALEDAGFELSEPTVSPA